MPYTQPTQLSSLPPRLAAALTALRQGRPVIVSDDDDRENEADLILAADRLSLPEMARLIRDGSGIVCLCLTPAHAARLQLPPMVQDNRSRHGTAASKRRMTSAPGYPLPTASPPFAPPSLHSPNHKIWPAPAMSFP